MRKIKISFIGAGFMSQIAHLENYYQNKQVQLLDLSDHDLDLAKGVHKKFNFSGNYYADYRELIKRKPDAIIVVVQRPLTNNLCNFILKNNINLFSEKPPAFSSFDFNKNKKIQLKNNLVWYKGFNRRYDKNLKYLKENYSRQSIELGKLIYVNYITTVGNTYRGKKHFVLPTLKNKSDSGLKNSFPSWLPNKLQNLYHMQWNSGSHYLDVFDYLDIKCNKILNVEINKNLYKLDFAANLKKDILTTSLNIINSKTNDWNEKLEFYFENGYIKIKFLSPLSTGSSSIMEIYVKNKNKKMIYQYENSWSFRNMSNNFVNDIRKSIKNKNTENSGENSLILYENSWKTFLKK